MINSSYNNLVNKIVGPICGCAGMDTYYIIMMKMYQQNIIMYTLSLYFKRTIYRLQRPLKHITTLFSLSEHYILSLSDRTVDYEGFSLWSDVF